MENIDLVFQKIDTKEILNNMEIKYGNIYIVNNKEVYCDTDTEIRKEITSDCILSDTVADLSNKDKLINKLYIVLEDNTAYRYDNLNFIQVRTTISLNETINGLTELDPSILINDNQMAAPATITNQVITDSEKSLTQELSDTSLITISKSKAVYVEVVEDDQRIFEVPFPKENYAFDNGDIIGIVVQSKYIESTRYEISDGCLILDDSVPLMKKGENLLIMFYYKMTYDMNNGFIVGTNNIADGAVTNVKISKNFTLSAEKVTESLNKIFFTRAEQDKLKGIEYNATCYHHPDTHPASMIIPDETHRFLTDDKIKEFEAKANADDVYTKKQTDDRFYALLNGAPEELDTLHEIVEALNNDPDFAGTMVKELAKKATNDDLAILKEDVDKRTYKNDYIRNTIYGVPSMVKDTVNGHSNYTLLVEDQELQDYADGMSVTLKISMTNEGDSYLRINKLDYKEILTQDGYELIPSEFTEGSIYNLRYNATKGNFILQGKGGVKINNTSQPSYIIGENQDIQRGDLVDIIGQELYKSVPRASILSRNFTTQSKFYSDGKIKVFSVSPTEFVVFWKQDVGLYVQRFLIKDNYIDINSKTGTYMVANGSCIDFDIAKIGKRKFMMVTSDNKNIFTAMTISMDADQFVYGPKYTRQESDSITNVTAIYLDNEKSIIAWQSEANTRTMYVKTPTDAIEIISNRDNVDYPLNKSCKVSNSQIIFAKTLNDNRIRKWTMNITSNDFFNSSLSYIVDSNSDTIYNNLNITDIDDNTVMMTAINQDNTKLFTWEIEVDPDRGSTIMKSYTQEFTSEQMKSNTFQKFEPIIDDGDFISVSKHNYKIPTPDDSLVGPNCMKISISNFDKGVNIISENSDIEMISNNLDFCMLTDKILGIVYNYASEVDTRPQLCFILAYIAKIPNAVAVQPGKSGDMIKVMQW